MPTLKQFKLHWIKVTLLELTHLPEQKSERNRTHSSICGLTQTWSHVSTHLKHVWRYSQLEGYKDKLWAGCPPCDLQNQTIISPSFHLPHTPLLLPTFFPLPPLPSWICRFCSTYLSTNGILATYFLGVHAAVRKSQLSWWFKGDFSASEKPRHSCILHHYKSSLLLTPNKETPPFNVPILFITYLLAFL